MRVNKIIEQFIRNIRPIIVGILYISSLTSCRIPSDNRIPPEIIPYDGDAPMGAHWSLDTIGSMENYDLSDSIDDVWYVNRENDRRFERGGYNVGDTVPLVLLYNTDGNLFNLDLALKENDYVVFVGASYSCNLFQRELEELKNLVIAGKEIGVKYVVVNTINAHPKIDKSPYRGEVWELPSDELGSCRMEITLGERMNYANEMIEDYGINTDELEVIVDNAQNEWWFNFGMGPTLTYVINKDRKVVFKQGIFEPVQFSQGIKHIID